ncbi:MAG: hypothetical protein HY342_03535 [Candidatus Lambdaproteobacteria bacterium]|nr:hypothetical protein [Candidatus Lambdaproteobacteria bacterium]
MTQGDDLTAFPEDASLRRLLIITAALLVLLQSAAWAQERQPLAMRIEFEWTAMGALVGAGAGVALWLTDPGNPNFTVARSVIEGVAWGTVAGAGFGLFVMQKTAIIPARLATASDPLDPLRRVSGDPVEAQTHGGPLLARGGPGGRVPGGISLPLLNLRF